MKMEIEDIEGFVFHRRYRLDEKNMRRVSARIKNDVRILYKIDDPDDVFTKMIECIDEETGDTVLFIVDIYRKDNRPKK